MALAQNVGGNVNIQVNFSQLGTLGLNVNQAQSQIFNDALQYVNASGSQLGVDQLFASIISLASAPQTLHFTSSGSLLDIFRNLLNTARIRELWIMPFSVQTGTAVPLKVYTASANGVSWIGGTSAAPAFVVPAASSGSSVTSHFAKWRLDDPDSFGAGLGMITPSSADGITFDPGANAFTVALVALGCSVA
jgi:hypothetical protein